MVLGAEKVTMAKRYFFDNGIITLNEEYMYTKHEEHGLQSTQFQKLIILELIIKCGDNVFYN